MSRTNSPARAVHSPITSTSRLLQHTASTYMKAQNNGTPTRLLSRDSLLFKEHTTPGRRLDSPTRAAAVQHTYSSSPMTRAESYSIHFNGAGVAEAMSQNGSRVGSRCSSPVTASPTNPTGSARLVRRPSMHREESLFGSEPCAASMRSVGSGIQSARTGLWTNQEGKEFTGSRKHYSEVQNISVTGQAQIPSLENTTRSLGTQDTASENLEGSQRAAGGKRITPQVLNLNGSACAVVGETQEFSATGTRKAVPSDPVIQSKFYKKSSPYQFCDLSADTSSAPPNASRMYTSVPTNVSVSTTNTRNNLIEYRERGWGASDGQAPHRGKAIVREVEGRSHVSVNPTNLGACSAEDLPDRRSSIKPMQGPPVFEPPAFIPRHSSTGRRCDSPNRSSISFGTHNAPSAPAAVTPTRVGRGVGVYSPLRTSSFQLH